MKNLIKTLGTAVCITGLLGGCNTSHPTGAGTGAVVGAGIGAGTMALLHGSKPLLIGAGLAGGAIGYYVTTLRFDSGGVMRSGGQVFVLGHQVGIYIPSDKLFEPNTADFTPSAVPILDSAADVLMRYPDNNILISGNTSGFSSSKREQKLSQKRAQRVAAYLWNAGVTPFKEASNQTRKLTYVGYGNYVPISNDYTNKGIRQNSRVQITSYPSECDLRLGKRDMTFQNEGALDDDISGYPDCPRRADG